VENPFAETRQPYQIWGVPTQKGEASEKILGWDFEVARRSPFFHGGLVCQP